MKTIKELRSETGLSQTKFGELCGGIPLRTVQDWEKGSHKPPEYVIFLIESYLFNLRETSENKTAGE